VNAIRPDSSSSAKRVFDRYDWIFVDPAHELLAQGVRFEFLLLERKSIPPIAAELGRGEVQGYRDIVAGHKLGALDRLDQDIKRVLVAREIWPPTALVGDAGHRPALVHQFATAAIDFGSHLQRSESDFAPVAAGMGIKSGASTSTAIR
jgi:hypothetical protein